jgi:chromosome segregation ATPase
MCDNYFIGEIKEYLNKKEYENMYPFITDFLELVNTIQNKNMDTIDNHILDFHVHLCEFNNKINNQDITIRNLNKKINSLENNLFIQNFTNKNLQDDNNRLNIKVDELNVKINEIEKDNKNKDIIIKKLEKDNKNKDIIIKKLEKDNSIIKYNLEELRRINKSKDITINKLEKDVKELQDESKLLKDELYNAKINRIYDKYIIAIQDINSLESLENKVDSMYSEILEKLRNDRVGFSHYININNDEKIIKQKRVILFEKIKNMPIEIKEMFEDDYPGLLDNIVDFICIEKVEVMQNVINSVEKWFNR